MSMLVASIILVIAAFLGIRRLPLPTAAMTLLALLPLLYSMTAAKALFVWMGLIGPVVMAVVLLHGLRPASD